MAAQSQCAPSKGDRFVRARELPVLRQCRREKSISLSQTGSTLARGIVRSRENEINIDIVRKLGSFE